MYAYTDSRNNTEREFLQRHYHYRFRYNNHGNAFHVEKLKKVWTFQYIFQEESIEFIKYAIKLKQNVIIHEQCLTVCHL